MKYHVSISRYNGFTFHRSAGVFAFSLGFINGVLLWGKNENFPV